MKHFIIKTSLFVFPFIVLFTLNQILYNQKEGDLVRLGFLYSNPSPRSDIENHYKLFKNYTSLLDIDFTTKRKFQVMTIGDSFSEQGVFGYKNFLGIKGLSVLHIDRVFSEENQSQTLVELLNSDFFDYFSIDYIVLQCIERYFDIRNQSIDFNKTMILDSLKQKIYDQKHEKPSPKNKIQFFSDATLKIPLTNIQYLFTPKPKFSQTYKYKSNCSHLFTNNPSDLLFYKDDILRMQQKNDSLRIYNSIKVLEQLDSLVSVKGSKLIVLVCPDKYDVYYNCIKEKDFLQPPLFFSIYEGANKKYINIDTYKLLSEQLRTEKDVYFYDDTHWTPKTAEIIANKIFDVVNE